MTIIGVDPHKSLHEACALDGEGTSRLRMTSSRVGYQKLIAWAEAFPERTWAIEGAHGLGRHLAQFLVARGETVVDVPAVRSARVRELGRSGNRKTDQIDALATALAARDATDLHPVQPEDTTTVVAMLTERRDNLVAARTRTVNQLHALLCDLVPGGLAGELSAAKAAGLLRAVKPLGVVAEQRKQLAQDLLGDIRALDRQLGDLNKRLDRALLEHGTTLTDLGGVGVVLAALRLAPSTGHVT